MKRLTLIMMLLINIVTTNAQSDIIAEFSPSSYDGWEYNRSSFALSTQAIIQYKVTLYKVSDTKCYTLTSPLFDVNKHECITVEFDWKATNFDQPTYSIFKGSPLIELIDENGSIVSSATYQLPEATLLQTITMKIEIPRNIISKVRVRLSAPKADVNSTGAIKTAKVYAGIIGGVNDVVENNSAIQIDGNGIVILNAEYKSITITEAGTGRVVYNIRNAPDKETSIPLTLKGVYIVSIGNEQHKILVGSN